MNTRMIFVRGGTGISYQPISSRGIHQPHGVWYLKETMRFFAIITFASKGICKLGALIIAAVLLVTSGCRQIALPDGVYMADVGESKITVVGNDVELDLSLGPEKSKRYVAQGSICNGHRVCPDGISASGKSIYFIVPSTRFSPFEIYELSWFYDGQNIFAVYLDKKIVTFTLNKAIGPEKAHKPQRIPLK